MSIITITIEDEENRDYTLILIQCPEDKKSVTDVELSVWLLNAECFF